MNTGDLLAAPQGFEPRYADPESAVLPLNEGAVLIESSVSLPPPDSMIENKGRSTLPSQRRWKNVVNLGKVCTGSSLSL